MPHDINKMCNDRMERFSDSLTEVEKKISAMAVKDDNINEKQVILEKKFDKITEKIQKIDKDSSNSTVMIETKLKEGTTAFEKMGNTLDKHGDDIDTVARLLQTTTSQLADIKRNMPTKTTNDKIVDFLKPVVIAVTIAITLFILSMGISKLTSSDVRLDDKINVKTNIKR